MLSLSDRTVRSGSESVGNRKAIANASQTIAVTAPETETETELTTNYPRSGTSISFRNPTRASRNGWMTGADAPQKGAA